MQSARKLEATVPPFFSQSSLTSQLRLKLSKNKPKFILLFVFSLKDCPACLEKEISWLNEIYNTSHSTLCQVIGIADTTSYSAYLENFINSMNIQFPVYSNASVKAELHQIGIATTPILFFIDSKNMRVIYAHVIIPTDLTNQDFENKIRTILNSANGL